MNNIKKLIQIISQTIKSIILILSVVFKSIYFIFKTTLSIVKFIFKILQLIFNYIKNLFRFSLTFKINIMYAFLFSTILFITNILILLIFREVLINNNVDIDLFYYQILFAILMGVNGFGVLLAIILGSKVSKKVLFPIQTMTNTVKDISIYDLDKRLDVKGSKDELKDLAQTFNEMLDRLEESYEKQNQFVSDASHELRTPISVIQGYANLLNRWGKNNEEVLEESILAIKSESENMKNLIEKLLFLARSDKNKLTIEKETFYTDHLLNEIIKETKLIDTNHKIITNTNKHILINADYKLLKQSFRIFIDNSIKFTPQYGTICINCYSLKNKIVFEIKDTGIGIPKKDIPYIFDRFYRVDKARSKKMGGNGLGLSIAKWIINNHNGSININSVVNHGTNVTIYIPYDKYISKTKEANF